MKVFKLWIENLAVWLLAKIDSQILLHAAVGKQGVGLPASMVPYRDEITLLCIEEEPQSYRTSDILGQGYFKSRRVMTKLVVKYPNISKRDLWKAVAICSDFALGGRGETDQPAPQ